MTLFPKKVNILKQNNIKWLTVDWLKENSFDVYFFGLGFIQVKINDNERFHFYHPDLPAYVESPHDHRYNFVSKVLKGRLINEIWEEYEDVIPASIEINLFGNVEYELDKNLSKPEPIEIEYASCQPAAMPGPIGIPDTYHASIDYVGKFEVNEGSSYYINRNSFHSVKADFSVGPCITLVTRGPKQKDFAKILRLPGDNKECPYSKIIANSELWDIVNRCLQQ